MKDYGYLSILFCAVCALLISACSEDSIDLGSGSITGGQLYGITSDGTNIQLAGTVNGEPSYWDKNSGYAKTTLASFGQANSIFNYSNQVYICGYISSNGTRFPCYWSNNSVVYLPVTTGTYGNATSIYVNDSGIFIAGFCDLTSSIKTACYWVNGTLVTLTNIFSPSFSSFAESICVNETTTDIYIAGYCNSNNTVPYPCVWTNGTGFALPSLIRSRGGVAYGISYSYNDSHIYVSGIVVNSNGITIPCYWNNGSPNYSLSGVKDRKSVV
jgi:hypothetical protein